LEGGHGYCDECPESYPQRKIPQAFPTPPLCVENPSFPAMLPS
jgi:RNA polymerase-binding transcription factor DksA